MPFPDIADRQAAQRKYYNTKYELRRKFRLAEKRRKAAWYIERGKELRRANRMKKKLAKKAQAVAVSAAKGTAPAGITQIVVVVQGKAGIASIETHSIKGSVVQVVVKV